VCKVAKTVQEASALIESGLEFVCAMEEAKFLENVSKQSNNHPLFIFI
jgi:hypothetical protein